jgi:hypothetical protein
MSLHLQQSRQPAYAGRAPRLRARYADASRISYNILVFIK